MGTSKDIEKLASAEDKIQQVLTDKPLSATQTKNLERLVDNDFVDLREKVELSLSTRRSEKLSEITAKYAGIEKKIPEAAQAVEEFVNSFNQELRDRAIDFVEQLKRDYPELQFPTTVINGSITSSIRGRGEAAVTAAGQAAEEDAVQTAFERLRTTAATLINAEHRKVQRAIILQGISIMGAQELVRDLPATDDIWTLVESELQVSRSDDLKSLMPTITEG